MLVGAKARTARSARKSCPSVGSRNVPARRVRGGQGTLDFLCSLLLNTTVNFYESFGSEFNSTLVCPVAIFCMEFSSTLVFRVVIRHADT